MAPTRGVCYKLTSPLWTTFRRVFPCSALVSNMTLHELAGKFAHSSPCKVDCERGTRGEHGVGVHDSC